MKFSITLFLTTNISYAGKVIRERLPFEIYLGADIGNGSNPQTTIGYGLKGTMT